MIFDTHAHYDDEQFDTDRKELLMSMATEGVGTIVNVGASYDSCQKVVDMAQEYPFMYAAVGIHPDEVGALNEVSFAQMKQLFQREKVVAVGEIGLDYYWDKESHDQQKKWFIRQLDLAKELNLPVLIHSREAAADTLEIMKEEAGGLSRSDPLLLLFQGNGAGVCKNGLLYWGIRGVVTFKNAKKIKEVAEAIPLEKILLETDCPYLAPVPTGENEMIQIYRYVAEEIARLKDISYEEVIRQTEENARKMYRL